MRIFCSTVLLSTLITWFNAPDILLVQHSHKLCIANIIDITRNMKIKNFGYSLKNIPIPTKSNYLKRLTDKTENFIRKLTWKAYHFCKRNSQPLNESENGYFEFKTLTTPPPNAHLNAFENDLYDLIQKVEFTNVQNTLQQKLKKCPKCQVIKYYASIC